MQLEHLENFGEAVFPSGNNVPTELSCQSGSWGFQPARSSQTGQIQRPLWEDITCIRSKKSFYFTLDLFKGASIKLLKLL